MNINEKAICFKDDLIAEHYDPYDYFFYNKCTYGFTWEEKTQLRSSFIDGMAWNSLLLGSCLLVSDESSKVITERSLNYLEVLDKVNSVPGRFARTFRPVGGKPWISSKALKGYFYRDGQAKAGPLSLAFAAICAVNANHTVEDMVRTRILNLYLTFIKRLVNDDFKILNADDSTAKHGDLNPWGFSGIQAFFTYTLLEVGVEVARSLDKKDDVNLLNSLSDKVWSESYWASRFDLIISSWSFAMNYWDKLLRLVGSHRSKFSNEHLLYVTLASWMFLKDKVSNDKLIMLTKSINTLHSKTRTWHNPFFKLIYTKITGMRSDITVDLSSYSSERRRSITSIKRVSAEPVSLKNSKPNSWGWKRDPFEVYIPGFKFKANTYAAIDYICAYNLGFAIGSLK